MVNGHLTSGSIPSSESRTMSRKAISLSLASSSSRARSHSSQNGTPSSAAAPSDAAWASARASRSPWRWAEEEPGVAPGPAVVPCRDWTEVGRVPRAGCIADFDAVVFCFAAFACCCVCDEFPHLSRAT